MAKTTNKDLADLITRYGDEILAALEGIADKLDGPSEPPIDPPAPPPPGQPGPIAWRALKHANAGTQIARVKPEDDRYPLPLPWVFEDNKQNVKGQGQTPAGAFFDYLDRGGKQAPTSPPDDLTADELEAAALFETFAPPTSCRRANDGFFCDAFRESGFHGKVGPFASYDQAVFALRDELGGDF